jgi:hypothetical protein
MKDTALFSADITDITVFSEIAFFSLKNLTQSVCACKKYTTVKGLNNIN